MKRIRYTGTLAHPESVCIHPFPRLYRGETVEVSDDAAAALLQKEGVELVKAKRTKKTET